MSNEAKILVPERRTSTMSALTSLLARDQIVPVRKIEEALQKQVVSGGEMSSVLLELDAISENTLAAYCAALYGLLPATRDEVMRVPRDTIRLVPRELAERHRMIPLAADSQTLLVAMARPLDREVEERAGFLLGLQLVTRIVCDVRISAGLVHHYGLDAPPRHTRLIDRLRQRDAGPVPFVAAPSEAQLAARNPSEAPIKRVSTADWLDDGDEEDTDIGSSHPPPPEKTQPQPFAEGRVTEPMGLPIAQAVRAPLIEEERTTAIASPIAALTPDAELETRARVDEGAAQKTAIRDTGTHRPSEPPNDTIHTLRRLRGPLTSGAASKFLETAHARDEILEIFFAFARQFFDYTALFVVHEDIADGRDAFGSGASAKAVRRIAIPLDVPGTFADVRSMLHPHMGPLASSELDALVLRDLEREPNTPALVLPVTIRGRAVLLLYGDRGGDELSLEDLPELLSFVPKVESAFKRLILRRKHEAGMQPPTEETDEDAERTVIEAAARALAPLATRPPSRRTEPDPPEFDASAVHMGESTSYHSFAAVAAAVRSSRPGARAADSSTAAIPEPPSVPSFELNALRSPRARSLESMLGIPRDAPAPPETSISLPALDGGDEPELTLGSAVSGEFDEDDLDEHTPRVSANAALEESHSNPPGSAYRVRDAAVDVISPRARSSFPPAARPENAENGHLASSDVNDASARRVPPTVPTNEAMPSVIVDMGDHVNSLVLDLTRCGPEDEGAFVDALVRAGEIALPTLAQAFPGPLWFDRSHPYRRLPRGRDISAISRALVAFRERAVPYVESLLGTGQPDRRFYAIVVAGDLVYPTLLPALSARVFDDDDEARAAALDVLPRFQIFPQEWNVSISIVRRAAKLRGRDPKRRYRATRALGALRDTASLHVLLDLIEDEDPELAIIAHRSLVEVTCEDMGTSMRRWAPWVQKNEHRHRIEWLIDALTHADEALRTAAGEELKVLTQQYHGYHPGSSRKEREVVQQKYRRWWDEEGSHIFPR